MAEAKVSMAWVFAYSMGSPWRRCLNVVLPAPMLPTSRIDLMSYVTS